MKNRLVNLFHSWIREYIPLNCPLCGGQPFDGEAGHFCAECLMKLPFMEGPHCPKCGGRLNGILAQCSDCVTAQETFPWEHGISLFRMEEQAKEMIHLFKYRSHVELARPLGMLAAQKLTESELKVDLIVPTPLHFIRYIQRGYNQSELLAREIARHTGIEMFSLLRRKKWTHQQAKLSRSERYQNLSDAFSIRDWTKCRSRCILLVDDVMTTGSTLSAAARTLLESGAEKVHVLVLARRQRN